MRQPRFFKCCLAGTLSAAVAAGTPQPAGPAAAPTAPSLIEFSASLPVEDMQRAVRGAAVAAFDGSPTVVSRRGALGVGADVSALPQPDRLQLSAARNGELTLQVPVSISITVVRPTGTDLLVEREGCAATTFTVSANFTPRFSDAGQLQYDLDKVAVDRPGYKCRIYTNVVADFLGGLTGKGFKKQADVNVAGIIRDEVKESGSKTFRERLDELNGRLPAAQKLVGRLSRPAMFGGVLALGIDAPRIRFRDVTASDGTYRIHGTLEGRPRLRFASDWTAASAPTPAGPARDGFRLPARLLFPTDRKLLPAAQGERVSACLGAFRLAPVPERQDLAVLQRCNTTPVSNVIWLSGANQAVGQRPIVFRQPLSDVLQEVLDWLNEPRLWDGVAGIPRLKTEVAAFQAVLARFQQDTQIDVDQRGVISFRNLGLDLHQVWVTREAIVADVFLTGQASLDIDLAL